MLVNIPGVFFGGGFLGGFNALGTCSPIGYGTLKSIAQTQQRSLAITNTSTPAARFLTSSPSLQLPPSPSLLFTRIAALAPFLPRSPPSFNKFGLNHTCPIHSFLLVQQLHHRHFFLALSPKLFSCFALPRYLGCLHLPAGWRLSYTARRAPLLTLWSRP